MAMLRRIKRLRKYCRIFLFFAAGSLSVLVNCGRSASQDLLNGKLDATGYLSHFIWEENANGEEVARSFANKDINYLIAAPPNSINPLPEEQEIIYLSHVAGLNPNVLTGFGKTLQIYVIAYPGVMTDFYDDKKKSGILSALKISDSHYNILRRIVAPGAVCRTISFRTPDYSMDLAYILTSQPFDTCNLENIYYSFGITHLEDPPSKDVSLCILYEARRQNWRTKSDIANNISSLRERCGSVK